MGDQVVEMATRRQRGRVTVRTDRGDVWGEFRTLAEARSAVHDERRHDQRPAALAGLSRPPFAPFPGEAVLESWAHGPTAILWFMSGEPAVAEARARAGELDQAALLVEQAVAELSCARLDAERGDPAAVQHHTQAALWRLLDAAGLIARDVRPDAPGLTRETQTGRGYWLGGSTEPAEFERRDRRRAMRAGGVR